MLAAVFFVAHGVAVDVPQQVRLLGRSNKQQAVLVDWMSGDKRHIAIVRGSSEEIDVHDDVCAEGAAAKKAHDAVRLEIKKRDVDIIIDCSSIPTLTRAGDTGPLRVVVDAKQKTRTLSIDNVPLFVEPDDGKSPIITLVARATFVRWVLDWRDADGQFRVAAMLTNAENNGVDVAALSGIKLGDDCAVSVASNIPLADNIAVTVAYALRSTVPVTEAQTTREKSVVYANDKCADVAKAIAAKVPGGASVDKLTWKAAGNAGVVVAIGDTATPGLHSR